MRNWGLGSGRSLLPTSNGKSANSKLSLRTLARLIASVIWERLKLRFWRRKKTSGSARPPVKITIVGL